MNFTYPILSPCINVCTMDPATGLCQGCMRTLEEVAAWSRMSDAQRHAVMAELPARRVEKAC